MNPTKRCPHCAEEIHAIAVKCKHCGSAITVPPLSSPASRAPTGATKQPSPNTLSGYQVVGIILVITSGVIVKVTTEAWGSTPFLVTFPMFWIGLALLLWHQSQTIAIGGSFLGAAILLVMMLTLLTPPVAPAAPAVPSPAAPESTIPAPTTSAATAPKGAFGAGYKGAKWGMNRKQVRDALKGLGKIKSSDQGFELLLPTGQQSVKFDFHKDRLWVAVYYPHLANDERDRPVLVDALSKMYGPSTHFRGVVPFLFVDTPVRVDSWADGETEIDVQTYDPPPEHVSPGTKVTYRSIAIAAEVKRELEQKRAAKARDEQQGALKGL